MRSLLLLEGLRQCLVGRVQGLALPVLPMVLPPAIQALMQSVPNSTPEQQAHQAAAAAAAAAAVMSSPYSAMMLPPSILPIGAPCSCPKIPACRLMMPQDCSEGAENHTIR